MPEPRKTKDTACRRKRVLAYAIVAVVLCAAVILYLHLNRRGNGATPTAGGAQASVLVIPAENPICAVYDEASPGGSWFYQFSLAETVGVPFTIQGLTLTTIAENGQEYDETYTDQQVTERLGGTTLAKDAALQLRGEIPVQDMARLCVTVCGTDENGHQLSFSGQAELAGQPKIDRSATAKIVVTPQPATAYLSDWGNGVSGWFFDFSFENVSDVPFKPDYVELRVYAGDRIANHMKTRYDVLQAYMENEKLCAGDWPMCIPYGTDRREATRVECIIFGTDDNGHELQFSGSAELSQDALPEE